MKTFEFEIQEVLARTIEIEATSEEEAFQKVKEMYRNEAIVLESSDCIDIKIEQLGNE
ncbi:MAG TPA: DpnD protein [Flavobacteriia bacterium]|nr:DpnD protein [Flavobacteriia bacterium]